MTNRRNIFSRFFRLLVMLHKISYAHFTEWNNKRKRKAFAAGIYFLSILPEFVLLAGTFLAARGQDGYVHLVNVPQKVVFYGLASLAVLLSAIPLGFFDDKKICKEVRQELRERPRYWKRAIAVYWAVIVAMVVAANIVFPLKSATKLFSVLLASKRPLITELADKLRLKYPLLPTISPCPTMRLEAIRSIIPISCRRYPKSV